MRARHHPLVILSVWAWQGALAFLASWPAASLVRAAYGNDPRGDSVLWTSGSHALLDFLERSARRLGRGSGRCGRRPGFSGRGPRADRSPHGRRVARTQDSPRVTPCARSGRRFARPSGLGAPPRRRDAGGGRRRRGGPPCRRADRGLDACRTGRGARGGARRGGLPPILVIAAAIGVTHDLARATVVLRSTSAVRGAGRRRFRVCGCPGSHRVVVGMAGRPSACFDRGRCTGRRSPRGTRRRRPFAARRRSPGSHSWTSGLAGIVARDCASARPGDRAPALDRRP